MPRAVKRTSKGTSKPTILWIEEDTLFLRELLQVWKPKVQVMQATSSEEALRLLQTDTPDLVVLDLAIPSHLAPVNEEEGFALLSEIRGRLQFDLPIVVVTRHADLCRRDRALEMGADAFLTKPVELDELEGVIGELLVRSASDSHSDDTEERGNRGSD